MPFAVRAVLNVKLGMTGGVSWVVVGFGIESELVGIEARVVSRVFAVAVLRTAVAITT